MAVSEAKLAKRRQDYEVYDSLPPKVREALRNAWDNLNSKVVAEDGCTEEGMLQVIRSFDMDEIDAWYWKIQGGAPHSPSS